MRADWQEINLGKIAAKITKGSTPTTYGFKFQNTGINFIKVENVVNGVIRINSIVNFISEEAHNYQERSQLKEGDILFSIAGTIGETCLVRQEHLPANTNQAFAIIHGYKKMLLPSFLIKQLESFVAITIKAKARGGAMNNVSLGDLRSLPIIIPPLPIQRAIVSKIETLFSDLDKGIADLNLAKEQLKIYRQAVLKKAFEGELTKEWREKQTNLLTADELLEQIKLDRQKHYEQQVEDWEQAVTTWEENAKEGKKPGKPKKPNEISNYSSELNNWRTITIEDSANYIVDCLHSTPKFQDSGKFCVDTTCIVNGQIIWDRIRYVSEDSFVDRIRRLKPQKGDILFAREGTVGTTLVLNNDVDICLGQRMMMFRLIEMVYPQYFMYYLISNSFIVQYKPLVGGTTSPHLNIRDIKKLIIPICSLKEQLQIVREIESRLSVCDKVEQNITEALEKSEALRQSILKKAFEGKLLSKAEIDKCKQEADYEPASVLLERIKKVKKK